MIVYDLVNYLYKHMGIVFIRSSTVDKSLKEDKYFTYKMLSSDAKDISSEVALETDENGEVYRILDKNTQGTISFISHAKTEKEAYKMAEELKDNLDYVLKEQIDIDLNVVIISTTPILDVTVRLVKNNDYRFNVDVTFRHGRRIKRKVSKIEEAKIKWR